MHQTSSLQQSFILREHIHGPAINQIGGYLEIFTNIEIESFKHARIVLIENNDAFRINIQQDNTKNNYLLIENNYYKELEIIDFTHNLDVAHELIDKKFNEPIDFLSSPLFYDALLLLKENHYIYFAKAHHIIMDGWGFTLWAQRLITLYKQICNGAQGGLLNQTFPSFLKCIEKQNYCIESRNYQRDQHYWLNKFTPLPDKLLPVSVNITDTALLDQQSKRVNIYFDSEDYSSIEHLATDSKAGILPVFLGVLYLYFTLVYGKNEWVVGLPLHNRHSHYLKSVIGLLMNINAIRLSYGEKITFKQLIQNISSELKSCYRHRRYSIEHLYRDLQLLKYNRNTLFEVMFNYQKLDFNTELNGSSINTYYLHNATEQTPLIFTLCEYQGCNKVSLHFDYHTSIYDANEAELTLQRIKSLLMQVCNNSSYLLPHYNLLMDFERPELLASGKGEVCDYSSNNKLLEIIQAHGQLSPNQAALTDDAFTLSYAELNERVNHLTNTLLLHQFSTQARIGLGFESSIDVIVALLAVMKVGAIFIPLLPSLPKKRLEYMIGNSEIDSILTLSETLKHFDFTDVRCIAIDKIDDYQHQNLFIDKTITEKNLAYIIYTSGSTGQPKGVTISHHSLKNLLFAMQQRIDCYHSVCWLSVTSPSFDISILEYLLPLLSGGHIILASSNSKESNKLINLLSEYPINFMQATPATWRILIESGWSGNKNLQALCGGETLTNNLASKLLEKVGRLWNCYGPTEATIWSLVTEVKNDSETNSSAIAGPLANTEHYILNQHLTLLPRGSVGELHIGGAGVADGYDHLPELTNERFISNIFNSDSSEKLFKTGDLVRYIPSGKLAFLGRMDDQIKIRGFRIELGEIEAHLLKHHNINEAIVLTGGTGDDNKYLVAYLVFKNYLAGNREITSAQQQTWVNEVKETLKQYLPDYMIPSVYFVLEKLPLTPNGKVDRKALPAPDTVNLQKEAYVAPTNSLEENLCSIWQTVLNIEIIGIHDNFFMLGGHSLLATRVISLIRQELKMELPLRTLFESPTVSGLSKILQLSTNESVLPTIIVKENREQLPLSYAQHRLWFIDQLDGGSYQYNMFGIFKLIGNLKKHALKQTLKTILERHEVLRTNFKEEEAGETYQMIHTEVTLPLSSIDLCKIDSKEQDRSVAELIRADVNYHFDLKQEILLRVNLLHLSVREHLMLFNMHHIVSDGWSIGLLIEEFSKLYEAYSQDKGNPLTELPIQYADYAYWQRQWLQENIFDNQLSYWKSRLPDIPPVHSLPLDKPRPAQQTFMGHRYVQLIDNAFTQKIHAFSQHQNVTLFMFLQTAFSVLLSRYSNETDIIIGSPIAGRTHKDIESLIGFFANTLVLRTNLSNNPSFKELLKAQKQHILDAYTHQHIPFEMIVEELNPERNLSHSPVVQIILALQNNGVGEFELPGLLLKPVELDPVITKFDLELIIFEFDDCISLNWSYNTDLFYEETIHHMAECFLVLLQSIVENPEQSVQTLPLLTEQQHRILHEWNGEQVDYPQDKCIHELFEQQVELYPNNTAIVFEEKSLTYKELNQYSNQLAHCLIQQGVKPDTLVGLCVKRSLDMIIGLMSILKAGGAYVPIDSVYPESRIAFMLEDCAVSIILTQDNLLNKLFYSNRKILLLDKNDWYENYSIENPCIEKLEVASSNLAYVIFTSGSTGNPKAVLVEHNNVVRLFRSTEANFKFTENDIWILYHSFSFDFSIWEIFGALLNGGKLIVVSQEVVKDMDRFSDLLETEKVTVLNQTPCVFYSLCEELQRSELSHSLRYVIFGGEALDYRRLSSWYEMNGSSVTQLVNMYGITETTVHVTIHFIYEDQIHINRSMIGNSLDDLHILICNEDHQLQPIGAFGELLVGGGGVARGYLNRPQLTSEKFVSYPDSNIATGPLYRTGDLVRWSTDGNLEFIGRTDHQVKIRGFRIELGEVEHALVNLPRVKEAVVVHDMANNNDQRLQAYITLHDENAKATNRILDMLSKKEVDEAHLYTLLNGMEICGLNKLETEYLYEKIFSRQIYSNNGIKITEDSCIFDIGANIGMFSVFLAVRYKNIKCYCYEPIPKKYNSLMCNSKIYGDKRIKAFYLDLSDSQNNTELNYYPNASVISDAIHSKDEDIEEVKDFFDNIESDQIDPQSSSDMISALANQRLITENVIANLSTISDEIKAHNIETIDLPKINVERSEIDVLNGINENDWHKIKQIVIEAHDINGKVEVVKDMLRNHGFSIIVEQDEDLKDKRQFNIYANRGDVVKIEKSDNVPECYDHSYYGRFELIKALNQEIQNLIPEYMIPSTLILLAELPVTANGKLNRKALPSAAGSKYQKNEYVAPRNNVEEKLCDLWREVLKLEKVGIYDNFFEQGGHSLLATRLISLTRKRLKVELSLRTLFEHPTVASLANTINDYDGDSTIPPIRIVENRDQLPLSFAQQRLWFIDQLEGSSSQYNMVGNFKLEGILNNQAFEKTLEAILERHEVFRTNFKEKQGKPYQLSHTDVNLPLITLDLSELNDKQREGRLAELIQADINYQFDLKNDLLLRVHLIQLSLELHILLVNMHHIVSDGWSLNILIYEFSQLYTAFNEGEGNPLPPLAIQYADYANWQREWLQGQVLDQQLSYWKTQLSGIPHVHSLPLDKPRPAQQTFIGSCYKQIINKRLTLGIHSYCQKQNVTLFMFLQTAFSVLLGRYSNETDIVIGSPIAGRYHKDVEQLIGFLVNTLVLRSDLSANPKFEILLNSNKQMILDGFAHQYIPFDKLVEKLTWERSLSFSPIFQILFVLQNNDKDHISFPGLNLIPIEQENDNIKFDLEVSIVEEAEQLHISWIYNTDLFHGSSVDQLAKCFTTLLSSILMAPHECIQTLSLLTETEKHQLLLELNEPRFDYSNERCIHQLFEEQVKRVPHNSAVIFEGVQLTYIELDKQSNQCAHYLIERGVKPNTLVGLYIERSLEMIVALLGILKAGGAYVPLSVSQPQARLSQILDESEIQYIVCTEHTKATLMTGSNSNIIQWLILDEASKYLSLYSCYTPNYLALNHDSSQSAYILYTSGSTGVPKGINHSHRSLVNWIYHLGQRYSLETNSLSVLQYAEISFDMAFTDIFMALNYGGCLHIIDKDLQKDISSLTSYICDYHIECLNLPYAVLPILSQNVEHNQYELKALKLLISTAEALKITSELRSFLTRHPRCCFSNHYGPTETHVVSIYDIDDISSEKLIPSIGRALDHVSLYVLDNNLNLQVPGVVGQLFVGGGCLAKGYINNPELSHEKFIQNPFSDLITERLYKSGDLVRYMENGELEYIGRNDDQVKIRGFRIELGEIETGLLRQKIINEAVVLVRVSNRKDNYIVAYITFEKSLTKVKPKQYSDEKDLINSVKYELKHHVPEYMVPATVIVLDKMPLTSNGKVDRNALSIIKENNLYEESYVAPRNSLELKLCTIWQDVLQIDKVGIYDDFFTLGGHSLLATRLISVIRHELQMELSVREIFEHQTIAEFSQVANKSQSEYKLQELTPCKKSISYPLSFSQKRLWIIDRLDNQGYLSATCHIAYSLSA